MSRAPSFSPDPEGEEVKNMNNITKTKRKEIPPREIRIKVYNKVIELHRKGLTYNEIKDEIEQEYGIRLSISTIGGWLRGEHNPYNGRYIPSLELLEPSEDLAYIIGVVCGDGHAEVKKGNKGRRHFIFLAAKDKEFVEEFAIRVARVLNRPRPNVRVNSRGLYYVQVESKTLCELLKKPIDIEKIRKFVEHCEKCMGMFLRGFFDSEGCISKEGYITLSNTDYELLTYVQRLLNRLGIEATGPRPKRRQGTVFHDPRTEKQYSTNKDVYEIYIRTSSNINFHRHIGFTIRRKQMRLEEYLRRRELLQEN